MSFHTDLPYLNYILDVIEDIEKSIGNVSKDKFLKEKDIKDANLRRIEIIGEAIKNLSINITDAYKNVAWKEIAGIKDRIANRYFGVDFNIIWEILKNDIPILKNQVLKIKKDLEKNGG